MVIQEGSETQLKGCPTFLSPFLNAQKGVPRGMSVTRLLNCNQLKFNIALQYVESRGIRKS